MSGSAHTSLPPTVQNLLETVDFRAPSLLVTIWGDTLAPTGDAVWLGSLIRLVEDFGLNERVVRTAVYRLQRDGWLSSEQVGRRSYYSLSDTGLARTRAADARIYAAGAPDWRGGWLTLIARLPRGRKRERLGRELALLGFGSPLPGVHVRPESVEQDVNALLEELGISEDVAVLPGHLPEMVPASLRALVAEAWDHDARDAAYQAFLSLFRPIEAGADDLDGAAALIVRTLLVHEFRRITLRDPMLPARLSPTGDLSGTARSLAGRLYWRVADAATAQATAILQGRDGRLSKPGRDHYHRFGGARSGE